MKNTIFILGTTFLVILILSSCSSVPKYEREKFCEQRNMHYRTDGQDFFSCYIDDITYYNLQGEKKFCQCQKNNEVKKCNQQ